VKVAQREMPPPRAPVSVAVQFTALETEHMPARENREKEIREWKRSQKVQKTLDPKSYNLGSKPYATNP